MAPSNSGTCEPNRPTPVLAPIAGEHCARESCVARRVAQERAKPRAGFGTHRDHCAIELYSHLANGRDPSPASVDHDHVRAVQMSDGIHWLDPRLLYSDCYTQT